MGYGGFMSSKDEQELFIAGYNILASRVHSTASEKGWWDENKDVHEVVEYLDNQRIIIDLQIPNRILEALDRLGGRNDAEMLCLMHSELSEALEGLRAGNPPDEKIPEFSALETELADVLIRMMDFGKARELRIAEAVVAKMNFNKTRSYTHGNKAF